MAKDKKSFIIYCDIINTVEKLDDKTAGELFKHLLDYVNDKDPKTDNILVEVAFEPIKQQLKRDLEKWDNTKEQRSIAGKKSAEVRRKNKQQNSTNLTNVKSVEQNLTNVNKRQQTSTNSTVNDNVNVNVNVNDNVNDNDINNIYNLYPSKCKESNRSTGKGSKNKDQIKKLIKSKSFEEVKESIEFYVKDCEKTKTYLKNFSTLLNNLPEPIKDPEFIFWRKSFEKNDTYRQNTKEELKKRFPDGDFSKIVILKNKPMFGRLITAG